MNDLIWMLNGPQVKMIAVGFSGAMALLLLPTLWAVERARTMREDADKARSVYLSGLHSIGVSDGTRAYSASAAQCGDCGSGYRLDDGHICMAAVDAA